MGTAAMALEICDLTAPLGPTNLDLTEPRRMTAESLSLDDIYRRYGALVHRRCLKILRSEQDAEDASQEVFVRVLRSFSDFRGQASPATWLYRIATNICLNRIRDAKNRDRLAAERFEAPEPAAPVESWPRDLVVRVLADFDEATRETVMYAEVEEMSYLEIAEAMRCSASLVRKRMAKFKERAPKRAARLLKATR
jgi:RNA polymerase sigma-70 factor, ECF subfamily